MYTVTCSGTFYLVMAKGDDVHKVEHLLAHRIIRGQQQYKVSLLFTSICASRSTRHCSTNTRQLVSGTPRSAAHACASHIFTTTTSLTLRQTYYTLVATCALLVHTRDVRTRHARLPRTRTATTHKQNTHTR
jgi:hypothetical protein